MKRAADEVNDTLILGQIVWEETEWNFYEETFSIRTKKQSHQELSRNTNYSGKDWIITKDINLRACFCACRWFSFDFPAWLMEKTAVEPQTGNIHQQVKYILI